MIKLKPKKMCYLISEKEEAPRVNQYKITDIMSDAAGIKSCMVWMQPFET